MMISPGLFFKNAATPADPSFRSRIKTDNPGISGSTQYQLPINSVGTYDFIIDWGDGSTDHITDGAQPEVTHTYSVAGSYDIVITGTCYGYFNYDTKKVLTISNWGNIRLTAGGSQYWSGCSNMTITATDILDLTGITSLQNAFDGCVLLVNVPNLGSWNTSNITNFRECFNGAVLFNTPLNGWNVSSAINMQAMFRSAKAFSQDLNSWNVSNVTNMQNMFSGSTGTMAFNGNITAWSPSSNTHFEGMFFRCRSFNQPIGNWDVSSATSLAQTFQQCDAFNQPLGLWNVQNVTTMNSTFSGALAFNQSLNTWTTTALLKTNFMFQGAISYNQPMDAFHVGLVNDMTAMFQNATSFNGDLSTWFTGNCASFALMFKGAAAFNQPVNHFDVDHSADFNNMFNGASAFNKPLNNWVFDPGLTQDFSQMFENATTFNQDLSSWDVTGVYVLDLFLAGATAFATVNYDKLLLSWAAQAVQSNMNFETVAAYSISSGAGVAKNTLQTTYSWTIVDGGSVP